MNRLISWARCRLGLRLIAKQPILSATIILALATGIGLATMGFTLRDAIVHGTLPYEGGERFARFNVFDRDGGRIDLDLERYHLFSTARPPSSISAPSAPARSRSRTDPATSKR